MGYRLLLVATKAFGMFRVSSLVVDFDLLEGWAWHVVLCGVVMVTFSFRSQPDKRKQIFISSNLFGSAYRHDNIRFLNLAGHGVSWSVVYRILAMGTLSRPT